jgi:uncharacterized protein YbjQ (UPF0145 family)
VAKCPRCGKKAGLLSALTADISDIGADALCSDCRATIREEELRNAELLRQAARRVIVTTTNSIEGYFIEKYIGIESVEYVIGTGVFSEMSGDLSDLFGLRSKAFESKLQTAKRQALDALRMLAAERQANAIVGIDLDFTEFSGNRVGLIVNGTLVRIVPVGLNYVMDDTNGSSVKR